MEVGASRRGRTLLHPFRAPRGDPERLRALLAAQIAAAGERDLEDLLVRALEHALSYTGHSAGAALVLTPSGDRLLVRAVAGNAAAGGAGRLTLGTVMRGALANLSQQAMNERRPLQHSAARDGQTPTAAAAGAGQPQAYLLLPLITARQRLLGTLTLFSRTYQQPLAPEDLEVLQALAAQVAPSIESAQLHEQLERTLDELLTLYGAGQAISSSLELQEVLSGILEMSRRLARADCCLITGQDASGESMVLAERGATPEWLAYRSTPGVRLTISAVLRDGSPRPLGMPPVTGWCIGLKVRQQVIGALEVYARGGPPRYDESHLLAGLATQAAIAIENAKLYQAVREKEAHLQDLVERMIQAQEEYARRVAYDIHDGLAQLMVSAHQHLQTFGMLHARQDEKADQALAKGLFMLQKSIEEVRKVIAGLRPSELDDFGLVAAIQLYVESLRDDFGWQVELIEEVGPDRLPAPIEVTAYRIVQEALTNARRHGDARRARVEMRRVDGQLAIVVQDWGRGFDVGVAADNEPGDGEVGRHVGLHGMRERAHLLGGTFEVQSTPGEGTIVRVTIPVEDSAAAAANRAAQFGAIGVADPANVGGGSASLGVITGSTGVVSAAGAVGGAATPGTVETFGEATGEDAAAEPGTPNAAAEQGDVPSGGVIGGWPTGAPADLPLGGLSNGHVPERDEATAFERHRDEPENELPSSGDDVSAFDIDRLFESGFGQEGTPGSSDRGADGGPTLRDTGSKHE